MDEGRLVAMNLFNLANVIEKKWSPVQLIPNLCTQIISPKSSCNRCIEYCPTNSICITREEIVIDDNCIHCGLCTTACPTNAILTQRPSFHPFTIDTIHQCKQNERVYLHCEKVEIPNPDIVSVSIPCLGAIPREAWLALSSECSDKLVIFHPGESCQQCEVTCGEHVWRKEKQLGEEMSSIKLRITSTIEKPKSQIQFDQKRRAFFSQLFSEVKTTNKLALKEWLANDKIQSYQEKIKDDPVQRIEKEWQGLANRVVEKITNEATFSYMSKRNFLLAEISKNESFGQRSDVRLPIILPECTVCGACALLCPTDALVIDRSKGFGHETITLHPSKCVDCQLCEEVCYFEQIALQKVTNSTLFAEATILIENQQAQWGR
jgi:ferredoxin